MQSHIDEFVANPRKHFSGPFEVLESRELGAADKRRILESWKLDAQQLATGAAENMTGGEESDLRHVANALLQLDSSEKDVSVAPRVHQSADKGSTTTRKPIPIKLAAPVGAAVGAGAGAVLAPAAAAPIFLAVMQGMVIGVVAGGLCSVFLRSSSR